MAFSSVDELIKKYKAGSLTSADLQENGITMSQVKYLAEEAEEDEREKMESERHNKIKDNKMYHDDDMESEEDKM